MKAALALITISMLTLMFRCPVVLALDTSLNVGRSYKGDVQILRALKAGAQGYLLKNTTHKELTETIRAVHAGKKALSPELRSKSPSMRRMMR
jgi:DNA-binding NarL/FixJ family response regulator